MRDCTQTDTALVYFLDFVKHETIVAASLQRPRIEDLRVRREVLHIAGDDIEAVALGGGHEQRIHHRQGLPGKFRVSGDLRPDVERGGIERQD
ncbi:MAG: hypothetical protein M3P47_06270, partial [Pseudomonadota bacterium]|nr:hypothetical protein [Pseudomonadota bacterium]